MSKTLDAGIVTAYGAAVRGGYTGTYEEFCAEQAQFADNARQVAADRTAVEQAAATFTETTVPSAVAALEQLGKEQAASVTEAGTTAALTVTETGTAQEVRVRTAGDEETLRVNTAGDGKLTAIETAGETQVGNINTAGATQVGNVNTAGATQVGNVNAAGATQVGNVNTAGRTQVDAIETKGKETLATIPEDYTKLTREVSDLKSASSLHDDEIDNTTQAITFDSDGNVRRITHSRNGAAVRTDTFTFAENTITEVRTLATGESLTLVTNLTTLETTVTYAAA